VAGAWGLTPVEIVALRQAVVHGLPLDDPVTDRVLDRHNPTSEHSRYGYWTTGLAYSET